MNFNTIPEALQDLKQGKIILVTDDPDRENEGDFICAAEFATTENVNFMATHGKGQRLLPCDRCAPTHRSFLPEGGTYGPVCGNLLVLRDRLHKPSP